MCWSALMPMFTDKNCRFFYGHELYDFKQACCWVYHSQTHTVNFCPNFTFESVRPMRSTQRNSQDFAITSFVGTLPYFCLCCLFTCHLWQFLTYLWMVLHILFQVLNVDRTWTLQNFELCYHQNWVSVNFPTACETCHACLEESTVALFWTMSISKSSGPK